MGEPPAPLLRPRGQPLAQERPARGEARSRGEREKRQKGLVSVLSCGPWSVSNPEVTEIGN